MPKSETSLNQILHEIRRIEEHRELLTKEKIKKIYKQLYKQLNEILSESYTLYADSNGYLTVARLQEQAKLAWFLEEIDKACVVALPLVAEEMRKTIEKAYKSAFDGMSEAIESGYDLSALDVNPYVAKSAMQNDISKLTLPPLLQKNRNEIVYEIRQILNVGLMNGERYETMTRRIMDRLDFAYGKSSNIVRTESHRNVESGFMDCAEGLQGKLDGSGLIYAATWRTMGDERVRPQVRYKTKKGWKTSRSTNGADHVKMEGQTVKAGEMFTFSDGVNTKAPGKSGVARHDCNCRCILEYNLMTLAEFKKATGKNVTTSGTTKAVRQEMDENGIVNLELQRTTNESQFDIAIKQAKNANKNGACVDTHPKDELETFKLFLADDGMAGVAVKPDGDITAVFKNSNSNAKGAVNDLIITARANGGVKMDCYGQFLVNSYEKCGYVPVARVPFNADYVTDQFLLKTRPDVYVMMKNTDSLDDVITKNAAKGYRLSSKFDLDDLPTFTDYDEALRFRDTQLAKQKNDK